MKNKSIDKNTKKEQKKSNNFSDKLSRQIIMFIILLFLGIIISWQAKTIEKNQDKIESARANIQNYTKLLDAEKEYTAITTEELDELKKKKTELLERTLTETGFTSLFESLQEINKIAGFTEISGQGVIVTLDDQFVDDPKYPANTSAIHDTDIRQVVDIMRSGGAIAISVNEQRVVSTSELTCNGPTVQINKRKYPVPYIIKCVGDPILIKDLLNNDAYLQGRILSNVKFKLEIVEDVKIPPFSDYDKIAQYIDAFKGDDKND